MSRILWPLERAQPQFVSRATTPPPTSYDSAVLAGSLVFAVVLFLPPILNDGDTLWQIATGRWILDHLTIPDTDPFSFTAGERRWFAHEWFAETLMAVAWRTAGMPGVMALTAAAAGLTAGVLMQHLRQFLSPVYAIAGLLVVLLTLEPSLLARPHALAWPCLASWCVGLLRARARHESPSLLLLPIMAVWVNLHGSFMLGLLLPTPFLIEALIESGAHRCQPGWGQVARGWLAFIAAAWGVALLNPDGLGGVMFPSHLLAMSSLAGILEWQPTDFSHLQPLELIICLIIALGCTGVLRLPPIRLLVLLVLIHTALAHARNQPLLGIIGVLILAEALAEFRSVDRANPRVRAARNLRRYAAVPVAAALIARCLIPLDPQHGGAAFAAMLAQLPAALRSQPVLNDYGIGGALIFNGVRPFVDGRTDLYGDEFMRRYRRITEPDDEAFVAAVSEFSIGWTIFPSGHKMIRFMDRQPGWHRLLMADDLVIHVRDRAR